MPDVYLVWSNDHRRWWAPHRSGYVERIDDAGRYSHAEALEICTDAMAGRRGGEPLPEIPVRLEDLTFMRQRFGGIHAGIDPEPPADGSP
jgi:hypothetical protein